MAIPKLLKAEWLTALVDTREQTPLELAPLRSQEATLDYGDYSLAGLQREVRVERKSLSDLLSCVGRERERFERLLVGLRGFRSRLLVIESTWADLEAGEWRSSLKPAHVIGSVMGWCADGIPVVLAGGHERAGRLVARYLWVVANRAWKQLQPFEDATLRGAGEARAGRGTRIGRER